MIYRFSSIRGWAQQLYFTDGTLFGADPLNDSLMVLWGVIRGVLGVNADFDGVHVADHILPPELEGTSYTFSWMGKPVRVCVEGNRPRLC